MECRVSTPILHKTEMVSKGMEHNCAKEGLMRTLVVPCVSEKSEIGYQVREIVLEK